LLGVVDISYVWTREGRLYLAVVLNPYSRRGIGWAVSNQMKRDITIRALKSPSPNISMASVIRDANTQRWLGKAL